MRRIVRAPRYARRRDPEAAREWAIELLRGQTGHSVGEIQAAIERFNQSLASAFALPAELIAPKNRR